MARKKKEEVVATSKKANIHDFDVLIEPLITEKTMNEAQTNKVVFKVNKDANKIEIRNAIERIYGVEVKSVRTVNVLSKSISRGSRYKGRVPGFKKAIITLKGDATINLFQE